VLLCYAAGAPPCPGLAAGIPVPDQQPPRGCRVCRLRHRRARQDTTRGLQPALGRRRGRVSSHPGPASRTPLLAHRPPRRGDNRCGAGSAAYRCRVAVCSGPPTGGAAGYPAARCLSPTGGRCLYPDPPLQGRRTTDASTPPRCPRSPCAAAGACGPALPIAPRADHPLAPLARPAHSPVVL